MMDVCTLRRSSWALVLFVLRLTFGKESGRGTLTAKGGPGGLGPACWCLFQPPRACPVPQRLGGGEGDYIS